MELLYFVYYNERPFKSVGDVNELIEVKTSANPKFYTNRFLAFKIQDLLNGMKIKGVTLDKDNFIVKVELEAEPIVKKYRIDILPATNLDFFHSQRAALKVVLKGKELELDNTMSFSLVGEENDIASPSDLNVTYSGDPKYVITRLVMSKSSITLHTASTELPITLTAVAPVINNKSKEDKVEHNDSVGTAQQDAPDLNVNQKHGICPISDVMALKLDFSKCKAIENGETINVAVKGEREDRKFKLVQSVNVPEDKLCKLSIPESWAGLTANIIIEDETGENVYRKEMMLPVAGTSTIVIDDSLFLRKTFKEKIKKTYLWIILILLFGLHGVGIGYVIHDIVNGDKHQSEQSEETIVDNPEDETETGEDIVEEEINQEENQEETEAKKFLAQVDSYLKFEDLKFDYVENCYDQYMNDSTLYARVDEENVLSKLKAYNTVVEWIKQGGEKGYYSLNACAWMVESNEYKNIRPHLNKVHQDQLNDYFYDRNAQKREKRKTYFLANHSSYDSFDDMIEDLGIVDRSPDRLRR